MIFKSTRTRAFLRSNKLDIKIPTTEDSIGQRILNLLFPLAEDDSMISSSGRRNEHRRDLMEAFKDTSQSNQIAHFPFVEFATLRFI